ncbi:hypothetical protein TI04_00515, partial [Achromatium sp. WMS2]
MFPKIALVPVWVMTLLVSVPLAAEIVTDGSAGAAATLNGPNFAIPQNLGTTVGNNLFHSFTSFNLEQNQTATFSGADSLRNVISRVTGGNASNIDGAIISQLPNADFYFINPYGIIFGPHSTVDVKGGFHVSTAQQLVFDDGNSYNAAMPAGSSFTAAAPKAFGFLTPAQPIQLNTGQLHVPTGASVNLAGGSITINNAVLALPQGNLRIYAQGNSATTVPISGTLPSGDGNITIQASSISVSSNSGGNLALSGGNVNILGAALTNDNGTVDAAGGISIQANKLIVNQGMVATTAYAQGKAGDVIVHVSGDMQVINGSILGSETKAKGQAGNVTVHAGALTINGGYITSQSGYDAPTATGNAGAISIVVTGAMQILNGG